MIIIITVYNSKTTMESVEMCSKRMERAMKCLGKPRRSLLLSRLHVLQGQRWRRLVRRQGRAKHEGDSKRHTFQTALEMAFRSLKLDENWPKNTIRSLQEPLKASRSSLQGLPIAVRVRKSARSFEPKRHVRRSRPLLEMGKMAFEKASRRLDITVIIHNP